MDDRIYPDHSRQTSSIANIVPDSKSVHSQWKECKKGQTTYQGKRNKDQVIIATDERSLLCLYGKRFSLICQTDYVFSRLITEHVEKNYVNLLFCAFTVVILRVILHTRLLSSMWWRGRLSRSACSSVCPAPGCTTSSRSAGGSWGRW